MQDKWQATDRLSITLGARYDRQQTSDSFDLWGIDTGSFNPRLGAAYALRDDSRDVIRASWGRINDLLYSQIAPNVGGAASGRIDEYDLNLDGTFETVRTTPAVLSRTALPEDRLLDPDTATPVSDEFHIGYTRQLPGRVSFDVAYVNKVFKNEIGTLDTNVIFENSRFVGYRNPAFSAIPMTTNLVSSKRKYHAVELSVDPQHRRAMVCLRELHVSEDDRGRRMGEDQPERYLHPADWFENDKLARPHVLRLNGSYRAPWGIHASAIYALTSGNFGAPVTRRSPASDPAFGPAT